MPVPISEQLSASGTGREVQATAPAKVNLFLHVTGKRPDGYHLLETLVGFCDFGDVIRISEAASGSTDAPVFSLSGAFAEPLKETPAEDNLVLKAARGLADMSGRDLSGLEISLEKSLPIAAGIGGGSADAAATLLALNHWWKTGYDLRDLLPLAEALGADVPMCLKSDLSWVTGIGEEVQPLAGMDSLAIVLVNPLRPLSTPAVFKARNAPFTDSLLHGLGDAGPFGAEMPDSSQAIASALGEWRNDLEPPALALEPGIGDILTALRNRPGCLLSRMSGSGATCFGLFETPQAAEDTVTFLAEIQPDWWARTGHLS